MQRIHVTVYFFKVSDPRAQGHFFEKKNIFIYDLEEYVCLNSGLYRFFIWLEGMTQSHSGRDRATDIHIYKWKYKYPLPAARLP